MNLSVDGNGWLNFRASAGAFIFCIKIFLQIKDDTTNEMDVRRNLIISELFRSAHISVSLKVRLVGVTTLRF